MISGILPCGCEPAERTATQPQRLHELGGRSEDVRTVPGVGRIAHCHDDQGTPLSLYEPAPQS